MALLSQLRQVSQVKRWDDGGTGRHTIRITDTLDFPDEEGLGMNIVRVWVVVRV